MSTRLCSRSVKGSGSGAGAGSVGGSDVSGSGVCSGWVGCFFWKALDEMKQRPMVATIFTNGISQIKTQVQLRPMSRILLIMKIRKMIPRMTETMNEIV